MEYGEAFDTQFTNVTNGPQLEANSYQAPWASGTQNVPIPPSMPGEPSNKEKAIIQQIALNPEKYPGNTNTQCKHAWRRFPMWCHLRDSVSRSYCTYCPTVGVFNRFGDVKHYPISQQAYYLVITKLNR